jgi:murein DD-endopeptidase MepM/ murein hydrolase activator NlpD
MSTLSPKASKNVLHFASKLVMHLASKGVKPIAARLCTFKKIACRKNFIGSVFIKTAFLKSFTRAVLFIIFIAASSCGHFVGPTYDASSDYTPQSGGENYDSDNTVNPDSLPANNDMSTADHSESDHFASPDDIYKSDDILKKKHQLIRGPFHLQWPVQKMMLTRGFSNRRKHTHLGLDLKGKKGSPILAAHDGTVIYAGSGFRGFGKMIVLEYDQTWATLYGHLNKFNVKTGAEVKAGSVIGFMGRTGHATGVHLHFELMRDKLPIDPAPFFKNSDAVAQQ